MTDRELLELAAKAAGIELNWHGTEDPWWPKTGEAWNPLTEDGDALRLAVKLKLRARFCSVLNRAIVHEEFLSPHVWIEYGKDHSDAYTATRRAIVRAAAEIGREMP